MKTARLIAAIAVAICLGLCGCTNRATVRSLEAADCLIESRPDSALTILEQIDPASLHSDRYRALYALLYTRARDENRLFQDSDSLISFAADYYRTSSDRARYAAALHYKSAALQRAGQNTQALAGYLEVIDIAGQLGDDFRLGLAASGIAEIFFDSYNSSNEVQYAQMAYDHIRRTGRQPYINYALRDLIYGYCNKHDSAQVARLVPQLMDSALKYQDSALIRRAHGLQGYLALWGNDTETAIRNFNIVCGSGKGTKNDSLWLAYAYSLVNEPDRVKRFPGINRTDSGLYCITGYHLSKQNGDYENAILYSERDWDLTSEEVKTRSRRELLSTAIAYHEQSRQHLKYELKASRLTAWIWTIVSATIILVIVLIVRHNRWQTKQSLNESLLLAELLREELETNESLLTASSTMMKKILAPRHSLIDILCKAVHENAGSNDDSTIETVGKIKEIINAFFDDPGTLRSLRQYVDSHHDNLFSDFRKDLPDLKDADYNLFLFSVLKFNSISITVLMKEKSVQKVYSRKRHLKDKIKELGDDKAGRYLAAL